MTEEEPETEEVKIYNDEAKKIREIVSYIEVHCKGLVEQLAAIDFLINDN